MTPPTFDLWVNICASESQKKRHLLTELGTDTHDKLAGGSLGQWTMQRTVQGSLASPGTAVMGKTGAHSVLRWTMGGKDGAQGAAGQGQGRTRPRRDICAGWDPVCSNDPLERPREKRSMGTAGARWGVEIRAHKS